MSAFLGYCRLSLGGSDCNRLLERFPEAPSFRHGCFALRRKLPMGFGASLVIVPSFSPGFIVLHVPFDQIRGDRTGGIASTITNLFWGLIKDAVQKNLTRVLVDQGMPSDTVRVDQISDPGSGKVGRIVIDLDRVNAWLARYHQVGPGLRVAVHSFAAREESLDFTLAVWQDSPQSLRPPRA
jgi:hypothetical protein